MMAGSNYRNQIFLCLLLSVFSTSALAATSIPLTVTMSEAVTVTGTPRVAVDVGGVTRYATYTSGSGTSALTFTLTPQAGDVDLDGIAVSSPVDLNGGTITDLSGNAVAVLTFTPPNTSGIKVNYPSLGMDFVYDADGRYTLNGTVYNDLPSFLTAAGGTFSRASTATYFDSTGTLQTAAANAPRFDYDPVTHAAKGILIEESRTNTLLYSSDYNHTTWTKEKAVIASGVTSPSGGVDAFNVVSQSVSGIHRVSQILTYNSGEKYTASIFVKSLGVRYVYFNLDAALGARMTVDLSNGSFVTGGASVESPFVQSLPNGWYRIGFTGTGSGASGGRMFIQANSSFVSTDTYFTGNDIDAFSVWGGQFESGAFATSYIPTTTAPVTRQNESLYLPTILWFNSTEGSLLAFVTSESTSSAKFFGLELTDSTNRNRGIMLMNGAGTKFKVLDAGWVTQADLAVSLTSSVKMAAAYMQDNFAASFNGGNLQSDISGNLPIGLNRLSIGSNLQPNQLSKGWVSLVRYYPKHVPNTQLQLLTQ